MENIIGVISATALSVIAILSWNGYIRESRRLRKLREKAELGKKIERKVNIICRDRSRIYYDFYFNGTFDAVAESILREEDGELKEMIRKYDEM